MNQHGRSFQSRAYRPLPANLAGYCLKCWFRSERFVSAYEGRMFIEEDMRKAHEKLSPNCAEKLKFAEMTNHKM